MSHTVSVRIGGLTSKEKARGQRRHDLRHVVPSYALPNVAERVRILVPYQTPDELWKEAERRVAAAIGRGERKRGLRSDTAVGISGLVTFGREAQEVIRGLSPDEQDQRYRQVVEGIAESLGTSAAGLVVHLDETAPHAHFLLHGIGSDGKAVRAAHSVIDIRALQDLAGDVYADLGITRGENRIAKQQRLVEEEGLSQEEAWGEVTHKTVATLHATLGPDLQKARQKVQQEEEKAQAIQREREAAEEALQQLQELLQAQQNKQAKNERLIAEQERKIAQNRALREKGLERIRAYRRRRDAARQAIAELQDKETELQASIARLKAIEQRADELATMADEAATEAQQHAEQHKAAEIEARARLEKVLEDENAATQRVAALRQSVAELEGRKERIEAILHSGILPKPPQTHEVAIKTGLFASESRQILFAEEAKTWQDQLLVVAAKSQDQAQQQKAQELEAREQALRKRERALQQRQRKQETDIQQREVDLRSKEQDFTRRQQQALPDLEATEATTRRIAAAVGRGMEALIQGLHQANLLSNAARRTLEPMADQLKQGKGIDTAKDFADRLTAFGIAIRDELPTAIKEQDRQRIQRAVNEVKPKGPDPTDDWW